MLNLWTLFHLNLMYSSLEESDRPAVIRRCYHRLLDLAASGLPLALEAPSLTLELIRDLDPDWLERLKELVAQGRIVFVGSGYSQIIAPLVPAEVNAWNFRLGHRDYRQMLGTAPDIWMINEMTYSAGLVAMYQELGVKAVIAEWNNARRGHPEWDRRLAWHRQLALGPAGASLPVIWIDTIDFQQLQRRAHGVTSAEEFRAHWQNRAEHCGEGGFAAVYGNDAEIFDFRPGRYGTEEPLTEGEWPRLEEALRQLSDQPGFRLAPVTAVLDEPAHEVCGRPLCLESAAQTVVVKKQEKYNLSRWALTGRGDLEANTACHRIAGRLTRTGTREPEPWRRLCRLWSSDLRTHVTPRRWEGFLAETAAEREPRDPFLADPLTALVSDAEIPAAATGTVRITADARRGLALRAVTFPTIADTPAVGTVAHGFFEDIALGADFYSGHLVIQRPNRPKSTDLRPCDTTLRQGVTAAGRIILGGVITGEGWTLEKQLVLYPDTPRLELRGRLSLPGRHPGQIHPVHLTFPPGFLDPETLAYGVCNGGRQLEIFPLGPDPIDHGEPYSMFVTAKGGLGATDGRVIIGDRRRRLVIRHDPEFSALVPMVHFVPQPGGRHFLRLKYSAQEIDETFVPHDEPRQLSWLISITAEARGLEKK